MTVAMPLSTSRVAQRCHTASTICSTPQMKLGCPPKPLSNWPAPVSIRHSRTSSTPSTAQTLTQTGPALMSVLNQAAADEQTQQHQQLNTVP
eukprot:358829-Chlamydomonas_euryale.AAC.12